MTATQWGGPLSGLRVVEFGGVGPAPFGTMLLADLGADVIRIERPPSAASSDVFPLNHRVLARGVRSMVLDLKRPEGREVAEGLVRRSEVLVEGFRPGVMERLGFGPVHVLDSNPALVYARMTGWGQNGPRAAQAGHDINYLAASGALSVIGRHGEAPVPPVNLVGDFGGGGMLLAVGVLAGVVEARTSGKGQVVDVAMLDGASLLTTVLHEWRHQGAWHDERGTNFIDTGAPFYDVYPVADGGWVAVGAIEGRFWAELLRLTGIDDPWMIDQHHNPKSWPQIRQRLADRLLELSEGELQELTDSEEACVTRVLQLGAVHTDRHNAMRGLIQNVGGVDQPAPAPRFSRTLIPQPRPAEPLGNSSATILDDLGYDADAIANMVANGLVLIPQEQRA